MKRRLTLLLLLLFMSLGIKAQRPSRIYTDFGAQRSIGLTNLNATLMFDFKVRLHKPRPPRFFEYTPKTDTTTTVQQKRKRNPGPLLLGAGGGAEYSLNSKKFESDWLFDIRLAFSLNKSRACYFPMYYTPWFASVHYKFGNRFTQHFICPELGYHIRLINNKLFLATSLNYYIPLSAKSGLNGWDNLYLALKLCVPIAQEY